MARQYYKSEIEDIAVKAGLQIVCSKIVPSKSAKYLPVPSELQDDVRHVIQQRHPSGIYSHQSQSIKEVLAGNDICVSTATASGKSLIFMATAAHILKTDDSAQVIAFYPQKALIQDQLQKWRAFLGPLGLEPAYIDGKVPTKSRPQLVRNSRVILMTPDVAHAWIMTKLHTPEVKRLVTNLRLLILDEAHVYDGVFGTNMAYFLRRFQAVCGDHRLICSTATLGKPYDFVYQLTGRKTLSFALADDGSASPQKEIILARPSAAGPFDSMVSMINSLAQANKAPFLAFCDSRKMVEQLVSAFHRSLKPDADEQDPALLPVDRPSVATLEQPGVLPYRAGYEEDDRKEIQQALAQGKLAGVVCTSVMELGVDIGDIELILLFTLPPGIKSFWQRFGRVGRRHEGICLLVDNRGVLGDAPDALEKYLARPLEPSWLYLNNRYIQYSNALCTASEIALTGKSFDEVSHFDSLPPLFMEFLRNEVNPTETVPQDLYSLKQEAAGNPHFQFPIRSPIDKNFKVKGPHQIELGELTFQQALREAYPGAIYYYMAKPYRISYFKQRSGEIFARRERFWTTEPIQQNMAFPNFQSGLLSVAASADGFIAEVELQVSEKVIGFLEKRGSAEPQKYQYGPGCEHGQFAPNRFFRTTGVCWSFPSLQVADDVSVRLLQAFCLEFGVQERDLGVARFHAKNSPAGTGASKGSCIYDSTNGSLRLTQRLAENFQLIVERALEVAKHQVGSDSCDDKVCDALSSLISKSGTLKNVPVTDYAIPVAASEDDHWVTVIDNEEPAIYQTPNDTFEIIIDSCKYTPAGLYYFFKHPNPSVSCKAHHDSVHPIFGVTKLVRWNLLTDEREPAV